jgi:hypothetical protein
MSKYKTFFISNFFFHFGGPIKIFPCNKKTTYPPLTFNTDLCRTLIKADIPLTKLKNLTFKMFLEKYTRQAVPEKNILRKNYVEVIYNETLFKI